MSKDQSVASPWLTIPEGASYLRMGLSTFRAKVQSGEIPSFKRSERAVFVDARTLDAIMQALPSGAATMATAVKSLQA
jgi:hypothetical protein